MDFKEYFSSVKNCCFHSVAIVKKTSVQQMKICIKWGAYATPFFY